MGRKERLGYRVEFGQQVGSCARTLAVVGDDFYRNLARVEFSVKGLVSWFELHDLVLHQGSQHVLRSRNPRGEDEFVDRLSANGISG